MNGKIVLLDGPSGSGKSRLRSEVLAACPAIVFCRRLTTRAPRGDASDEDYHFVTPEAFAERARAGDFAAYRDFQFGMSYGLPRSDVEHELAQGNSVLALIDLGTVDQAKTCWPEARCVLLYSPLDELRARLLERGGHSEAQIEERLGNAQLVWERRHEYDRVLLNRQGQWDETLSAMLALC